MSLTIRLYESRDRDAYLALVEATFGDARPHNDPAATLDRVLATRSSVVLVAEEDEDLVGAAIGGYDGCRGWLYSVAVDAVHQRKGVGSQLVRSVEAALRERGCPKMNLQVRVENESVIRFYESLGYDIEQRVSMGKLL